MPGWKEVQEEVGAAGGVQDIVRRKYLQRLHRLTGRNVIVYYSGWMQRGEIVQRSPEAFALGDVDKNAFMATIHKLDRSKGLDLVLHTPGGAIGATESIVDYLRSMFGTDIRAIVPQLALSAGTMISLSCREVVMGKHSSLGPIDPQLGGVPAHALLEELDIAVQQIKADPTRAVIWQAMLAKYPLALVNRAQKAIQWSEALVQDWLLTNMLAGDPDAAATAANIVEQLGQPQIQKSHDRHVSASKLKAMGVKVFDLEGEPRLQDAVLTLHHACVLTLTQTLACKIVENHNAVGVFTMLTPRPG